MIDSRHGNSSKTLAPPVCAALPSRLRHARHCDVTSQGGRQPAHSPRRRLPARRPKQKGRKGSGGRRPAPTAAQALQNARKTTKGVKIGRPRTYSPALCDEAVKLGSKGYSKASIAYTFGVSRAVLDNWVKEFPAFMEALARAHDAAQHWFERHGQRNLKADRYQAQVWTRRMQAQFNEYKDLPPSMNVSIGGDLLDALTEATNGRAKQLAEAARRVEPLDVVINHVESPPEKR